MYLEIKILNLNKTLENLDRTETPATELDSDCTEAPDIHLKLDEHLESNTENYNELAHSSLFQFNHFNGEQLDFEYFK
jgi:hypothetical protein